MNWFTTNDLLKRSGPFTLCVDYIVWYILAAIVLGVGIYFLCKRKSEKVTKIVFIVLWAVAVAIDVTKLIVNICTGFNIGTDIPLYICSIFMYVMPFAIWGKGLLKRIGCAIVCSIGLFGAIGNYVVPTVIVKNSLFSFSGFHTTLYHTILIAVPLIMLCTGYFKFKFKDYGWTYLGFFVLTIPALILNFIAKTDYMYLLEGNYLPLLDDVAEIVGCYVWPIIMYVVYAFIIILMQLIVMGVTKLVENIVAKINANCVEPKPVADGVDKNTNTVEDNKNKEQEKNNE
ncbi:MAG: YwaF family protein [Clostridia bacterium]|nr:YwaF family protein [Clostridia bacterium]